MEQDLEQSPIHREPTACSEPPVVQRDAAFKDLLLHVSQNLRQEDAAALAFAADCTVPAGATPPALEVLQALMRQGDFSARSCGRLDDHLRRINRCDLAALVETYIERYPEPPPTRRHTAIQENGTHQPSSDQDNQYPAPANRLPPSLSVQHRDENSDLQVFSSGASIPAHSTPKHHTPSPNTTHEMLDALSITHSASLPVPCPGSLRSSSEPTSAGASPHQEMVSEHSHETGDVHSSYEAADPHQQEGVSGFLESANISRDNSDLSLSSSASQLSRASLQKASQILYSAMDAMVNYSQDQLWYRSNSSASIPRPPHSDNSSTYSDITGAGRENPWGKKQSRSFHGCHSVRQVKMRRTPSAPGRNRNHVDQPLASLAPHDTAPEQPHADIEVTTQKDPIPSDHTDSHDEGLTMVNIPGVHDRERGDQPYSSSPGQSDATPRQSVAVDIRRQSTLSDATIIKRNSAASEAHSEHTVTSPRTSVHGKEAIPPDLSEETATSNPAEVPRKPTFPVAPKEKSRSLRKPSFLRSHSRTSSAPSFSWRVAREELIKPIWRHRDQATVTRSSKLELDTGHGKHNPKLTFQLFPYGLHGDKGNSVTMAVRIATPDKCPPLPLSSEIHLKLGVSDGDGRKVKECLRVTEKLSTTGIFYVYSAITHDQLKESKSKYFYLEIDVACSGLEKQRVFSPI